MAITSVTEITPTDGSITVLRGEFTIKTFWGVTDENGNTIVDHICEKIERMITGYFVKNENRTCKIISPDGKLILEHENCDYVTGKWLGFTDKVKLPPTD